MDLGVIVMDKGTMDLGVMDLGIDKMKNGPRTPRLGVMTNEEWTKTF